MVGRECYFEFTEAVFPEAAGAPDSQRPVPPLHAGQSGGRPQGEAHQSQGIGKGALSRSYLLLR